MLSLETVKQYLRIDVDDFDTEIESMILGAESYFSKETNHVFGKVEKEYFEPFRIYDFPVHDTEGLKRKNNYYIPVNCPTTESITVEVGYENEENIPADIVECLLQIIKVWYYESENEQNSTLLPMSVKQVIQKNKRFYF
jgi:hypothetical protein